MPSIQILFFSNQFQCIIPQFHKSLTNFNISYKIQHQTLTIHSLDFSNPNLIHLFLNFYQIHHDSTLNTPIRPSIQENQSIRYGKHQNQTFPPLKTYLLLVFLGSSLLIPLVDHLKSLNEEKKITSHTLALHFFFFLLLSLLYFLYFLPSFSHSRALPFLSNFKSLNLDFDSHLPKLPLNQIILFVHSYKSLTLT